MKQQKSHKKKTKTTEPLINLKELKEKEKHPLWIRIIDWTLLLTLLTFVIYAQLTGGLITKIQIVETCQGEPLNQTLMEQLEQRGIVTKWNQTTTQQKNQTPIIKNSPS